MTTNFPLPDQAALSPTSPQGGSKTKPTSSSYFPLEGKSVIGTSQAPEGGGEAKPTSSSYFPLEGKSVVGTSQAPEGGGLKTRKYNPNNRNRALSLRKNMTDHEVMLWSVINKKQLGAKFRRQQLIGNYIVDFICYERKLILEADGSQHVQNEYDKKRDTYLKNQGYRVERLWNNAIWEDLSGVRRYVEFLLRENFPLPDQAELSPTSPQGGSKTKPISSSYFPLPDQAVLSPTSPQGGSKTKPISSSYFPLEGKSVVGASQAPEGGVILTNNK